MDLRKSKSKISGIAELILRLRWVWILFMLVPMVYRAIGQTDLLEPFLAEVRMQHKFTLQFLFLKEGGFFKLLIDIFSVGSVFLVPLLFISSVGAIFKNRLFFVIFPLSFITMWQILFLKEDLQNQFVISLLALGVIGIIFLKFNQVSGAFIVPAMILAAIILLFGLNVIESIHLGSLNEIHWSIELMFALIVTDFVLFSISTIRNLKAGRPKLASIVGAVEDQFLWMLLRNVGIVAFSGFWLGYIGSSFVIPFLFIQGTFLFMSLMMVLILFPALLSILPIQTKKSS